MEVNVASSGPGYKYISMYVYIYHHIHIYIYVCVCVKTIYAPDSLGKLQSCAETSRSCLGGVTVLKPLLDVTFNYLHSSPNWDKLWQSWRLRLICKESVLKQIMATNHYCWWNEGTAISVVPWWVTVSQMFQKIVWPFAVVLSISPQVCERQITYYPHQ